MTTGKAEVTGIISRIPEAGFLSLIAGLEAHSEHPIGEAVRRYAAGKGISSADIRGAQSAPSEGITGTDAAGPLWAGNGRMAVFGRAE